MASYTFRLYNDDENGFKSKEYDLSLSYGSLDMLVEEFGMTSDDEKDSYKNQEWIDLMFFDDVLEAAGMAWNKWFIVNDPVKIGWYIVIKTRDEYIDEARHYLNRSEFEPRESPAGKINSERVAADHKGALGD